MFLSTFDRENKVKVGDIRKDLGLTPLPVAGGLAESLIVTNHVDTVVHIFHSRLVM